MHRIVSVVSGNLAAPALAGEEDTAISREAREVRKAAREVAEARERSLALFGAKAEALSRLAVLATECGEHGWDGKDAAAVDPSAVLLVHRFLRAMPDDLPIPEFAPRA